MVARYNLELNRGFYDFDSSAPAIELFPSFSCYVKLLFVIHSGIFVWHLLTLYDSLSFGFRDFLQSMQGKMMSQISNLTQKVSRLEEDNKELQTQVSSRNRDGCMKTLLQQKDSELSSLKAEMDAWQKAKDELADRLENALKERDSTIGRLRSELGTKKDSSDSQQVGCKVRLAPELRLES